MKIKFLLAALLFSTVCFGQVLHSENGVSISYDGSQKIGTRYEEKCETTFDVYRVTGTVKNANSDKAVKLSATSLTFNGNDCGWYEGHYRVESEAYNIFFTKSQTWKGYTVDILPNSQLTLSAEVLVTQDRSCPQPGYSLHYDFVTPQEQPTPPQQQVQPKVSPQWSEWRPFTASDCNLNIEYRYLVESGFALNYQVHMWFEVKNNNDKTVSYTFNLLDNNNKIHFGDRHTTDPGETTRFVHKMSGDFIKKMKPVDVVYTSTGKPVCEKEQKPQLVNQNNSQNNNQNSQGADQNNSQNNFKTIDAQINEKLEMKADLCLKLSKTSTQSSICNKTATDYMTGLTGTDSQISNRKHTILSEIGTDISELESLLRQSAEKQMVAEKKQKDADEQQKKFDGLITQGDNAFTSRNYDNAMGHYSQAQNIALNDTQKNTAQQKYNQANEAKLTLARTQRVTESKERDKTEDAAYTAVAGATMGAMSMLKDGYTHRGFSAKIQLGVGYDQTPMITNQNNTNAAFASYTDKVSYPAVDFGLRFEILNNKPVNVNLRGVYSLGMHAFETGVSGLHTVTGVDGGVQFWYKTVTKFKLFADFGWYQRTGERTRDQDAVNDGETATDDVREGTYKYEVMRLGFGPMLHFRDGGKETWIKPGVYFDKISFAKKEKPTMVFSLNANIKSSIIIEVAYSKDYPVGGTITYPDSFTGAKQDYFSIRIIRQGKLW